jgi:methionine-rich copper-binding protein CopC
MQPVKNSSAQGLLLGTLVLASLVSAPVAAHVKLLRSSPAADATIDRSPAQLRLWFSEEPLLPMSAVTLTGPKGVIKLDPPRAGGERSLVVTVGFALESGAYRINWKTAGDDGHVLQGTVNFSIKPAK